MAITQQQFDELKRQVEDLTTWKNERTRQLVTYPMDKDSIEVLNQYFTRVISEFKITAGVAGRVFTDYLLQQGKMQFTAPTTERMLRYTVNATTNVFTLVNGVINGFPADDTHIYFSTEDTAPDPIDTLAGDYYVISSSGATFKISATVGGAEIDITDTGIGAQYVNFF